MTRLLFINRYLWPDVESTGQNLKELCDDLSSKYDITFIAGPSPDPRERSSKLWTIRRERGYTVIRTWGTRLPKCSLAARLLNFATFYLLAALATLTIERPDILIAETDPPLLGALGALLKYRWRCRYLYNIRDLYPDIAVVTGGVKSRLLLWLLDHGNHLAYKCADLIVVLGDSMRDRVVAKGVPAEKVVVVPNWSDCDSIRPVVNSSYREEFGDKFVVMYSGNLGLSQQLEVLLEAADRLRKEPRVLFVLIGDGARKRWLEARAAQLALDNIRFFSYRPAEYLSESLSSGDLHIIPLLAGAEGCIAPSKTYVILAAGRPFVAIMNPEGEPARLAMEYKVGFVVKAGDCRGLVKTIEHALANPEELKRMGQRARNLAEHEFERHVVTHRFSQVIETHLLSSGGQTLGPRRTGAASGGSDLR